MLKYPQKDIYQKVMLGAGFEDGPSYEVKKRVLEDLNYDVSKL